MFLVRETWMRLVYKFLVPSFSYEFLVPETWTVCHQLNNRQFLQSQTLQRATAVSTGKKTTLSDVNKTSSP